MSRKMYDTGDTVRNVAIVLINISGICVDCDNFCERQNSYVIARHHSMMVSQCISEQHWAGITYCPIEYRNKTFGGISARPVAHFCAEVSIGNFIYNDRLNGEATDELWNERWTMNVIIFWISTVHFFLRSLNKYYCREHFQICKRELFKIIKIHATHFDGKKIAIGIERMETIKMF